MKELRVNAIKDGTVIDHLPAKSVFKIVEILGLIDSAYEVLIGTNLKSQHLGKKGVIKLSKVSLDQKNIDAIALLAEGATISIIQNYDVAQKHQVEIPKEIHGIAKCFNPHCITNHENVTTRFEVLEKNPVILRCHYCEKIMDEANLEFR